MQRLVQILVVVSVWSVAPILKRVVLDYMKFPDAVLDANGSPVRTFVAINSLGCTIAAAALAVPTQPMQFVRRLPSEGWAALLAFAFTLAPHLRCQLCRHRWPRVAKAVTYCQLA